MIMVSKEKFVKDIMWLMQQRKYKRKYKFNSQQADFYNFKRDRVKTCSHGKFKGSQKWIEQKEEEQIISVIN